MVTDIFAVIADRTRRDILDTLRTGDKAVGELVEALEASQPTVSKHLKVLRDAGLVTTRAQGQKRYYTLRLEPLEDVSAWLAGLGEGRGPLETDDGGQPDRVPGPADVVPPAAPVTVVPPAAPATVVPPAAPADVVLPGAPATVVSPAAQTAPPAALPAGESSRPASVQPAAVQPAVPAVVEASRPAQLQRTVERAAARATELMANLPKFGRRK